MDLLITNKGAMDSGRNAAAWGQKQHIPVPQQLLSTPFT